MVQLVQLVLLGLQEEMEPRDPLGFLASKVNQACLVNLEKRA